MPNGERMNCTLTAPAVCVRVKESVMLEMIHAVLSVLAILGFLGLVAKVLKPDGSPLFWFFVVVWVSQLIVTLMRASGM